MHHLTDTAELAAELSAVDGVPLAEAQTLAAAHLGHITREAGAGTVCTNCGRYGHSSADCPRPPLPLPGQLSEAEAQALVDAANDLDDADDIYALLRVLRDGGWPASLSADSTRFTLDPPAEPEPTPYPPSGPGPYPVLVNISDRPRCSYCTGPHTDAECPLRRPVFVARDPAEMPLRFRARELGAEIVDWGRHGYVLLTDEGQVTIGASGQDVICLSLAQARALRALLALPQVRSLLLA